MLELEVVLGADADVFHEEAVEVERAELDGVSDVGESGGLVEVVVDVGDGLGDTVVFEAA